MSEQAWTPEPWIAVRRRGDLRIESKDEFAKTHPLPIAVGVGQFEGPRIAICVNALAGIEDPPALRKLLDDLQIWQLGGLAALDSSRTRLYALDTILDELFNIIPKPEDLDEQDTKPGDQSEAD